MVINDEISLKNKRNRKAKQLVYISHPSGGLEENRLHIEKIIRALYRDNELYEKYCFVSPVHCYGFMYKEYETNYLKGLTFCTDLLKHCDIMLLCGDWEKSRGCKIERNLCYELSIPIRHIRNDEDLMKIIKEHKI